jgi:sphinganine-1-phosphate aldolase
MKLPENGRQPSDVLSALDEMRANDARWRDGRTFSLVYYGGDELLTLLHDAFFKFFSENALNPMAFPSLRRMETEVLSMVADLLHGPDAAGSMTTGGTESILMAVKTAREFAAQTRGITQPEMILPDSVHPAFHKAAHYFNVKPVVVPVGADYRADVAAMRAAITPNTILLVGSAPSYPQGVVDPIPEIAALAEEHGLLCHVDACLGGMLLPFFVKLGQPLPAFDFAVPGVTSMSCDLHKYGYAAKGASTVLYRGRALRRHQFVVYTDWSGGLYGSPSMTGTRAGGPIGAAWAVLNYLGESGYLRMARQTLDTVQALVAGVRSIPGMRVLGEPDMSVFSFTSDDADIYRVGDEMDARGWHLDRQQRPPSLHMMITAAHTGLAPQILADLAAATELARAAGPATSGAAAMYGMMGSLPDRTMVREFVLDFMDGLDR